MHGCSIRERTSTITNFVVAYTDRNRKELLKKYKDFQQFDRSFSFGSETLDELKRAGEKNGVKFNEGQYDTSYPEMVKVMKGLVARDLWDMNEYYMVVNRDDEAILKALSIISDSDFYNSLLGNNKAGR
ncbi:MAG: hypothetical protein MUC30_04195 [Bacteroidales bacterium]|nr:hypothetical protein [Bacteroidales bacterium]